MPEKHLKVTKKTKHNSSRLKEEFQPFLNPIKITTERTTTNEEKRSPSKILQLHANALHDALHLKPNLNEQHVRGTKQKLPSIRPQIYRLLAEGV